MLQRVPRVPRPPLPPCRGGEPSNFDADPSRGVLPQRPHGPTEAGAAERLALVLTLSSPHLPADVTVPQDKPLCQPLCPPAPWPVARSGRQAEGGDCPAPECAGRVPGQARVSRWTPPLWTSPLRSGKSDLFNTSEVSWDGAGSAQGVIHGRGADGAHSPRAAFQSAASATGSWTESSHRPVQLGRHRLPHTPLSKRARRVPCDGGESRVTRRPPERAHSLPRLKRLPGGSLRPGPAQPNPGKGQECQGHRLRPGGAQRLLLTDPRPAPREGAASLNLRRTPAPQGPCRWRGPLPSWMVL